MPTTVVGEFLYEVSGSDLLGIPDFNGNDQSTTVTLTVFEDRRARYNGSPLLPQVNEKASDGTIAFITYDVRHVLKAIGRDLSAWGLSQEDMNAYGAFFSRRRTIFCDRPDGGDLRRPRHQHRPRLDASPCVVADAGRSDSRTHFDPVEKRA